jgi:1-deoxy-D-xylulose-5-phosphate synthase
LIDTFDVVREFEKPVVVHVITEKGRGYQLAEKAPEKFHGLSPFDPDTGESMKSPSSPTFSSVFGDEMVRLAGTRGDIVAITAGMRSGTGLTRFSEKFPDRFFDVGIAEEHAVVFAAGLATDGVTPVVAMYATFLQRALDCVFHDVCLQNLPVVICADRAGIVDDGPTHHGILDLAFLLELPNLSILAPRDAQEFSWMLESACDRQSPVVIRYPKAVAENIDGDFGRVEEWGRSEMLRSGDDLAIWALGRECATALEVAGILEGNGVAATVVDARFLKPFDAGALKKQAAEMQVVTIEDGHVAGGLGGLVALALENAEHKGVHHFGWSDDIPPHGTVRGIRESRGMSSDAIARTLVSALA